MSVFVIDNYDSFTYNLVHYVEQFDRVTVKRYHEVQLQELNDYDAFIISPGPGVPQDYPLLQQAILTYASSKHILGICLGHEAIGLAYGCKIRSMNRVMHGEGCLTQLTSSDTGVFQNLPNEITTGRYHSWCLDSSTLTYPLEIIANDHLDSVAAIRHQEHNIIGMQFHPESIITESGIVMIENWIRNFKQQ